MGRLICCLIKYSPWSTGFWALPLGPSKQPSAACYLACEVSPPVNEASRSGERCSIPTFVVGCCWDKRYTPPRCSGSARFLSSHSSLRVAAYSRACYHQSSQLHRYSFIIDDMKRELSPKRQRFVPTAVRCWQKFQWSWQSPCCFVISVIPWTVIRVGIIHPSQVIASVITWSTSSRRLRGEGPPYMSKLTAPQWETVSLRLA